MSNPFSMGDGATLRYTCQKCGKTVNMAENPPVPDPSQPFGVTMKCPSCGAHLDYRGSSPGTVRDFAREGKGGCLGTVLVLVSILTFLGALAFVSFADTTEAAGKPSTEGAATSGESFWTSGLAGVCGGKTSGGTWFLSIIVFLLTSGLIVWIAGALAGSKRDVVDKIYALAGRGGGGAVGWFLLFGGAWYVVYWGFPGSIVGWSIWLVALVVYLFVGGGLSDEASNRFGPHVWFT
jgi:hypothetical protein